VSERIQLRRTKGWRMPPNTVKVGRPGPFGNPFVVAPMQRPGSIAAGSYVAVPTVEDAVECYRIWLTEGPGMTILDLARTELRGKNLACWCKPGDPCHADVLLELANADE
jgi:uncharacterized protein DUF4326